MGRWQPGARGRLEKAALELVFQRGYDNVTVAQIAERAGLTERTFFRYFADKREVLFAGGGAINEFLAERVEAAPSGSSPFESAVEALAGAAEAFFEDRRELVIRRQAIVTSTPELRERELIKLAGMVSTLADALHRRGAADPVARMAAEAAIAAFKSAFARWVELDGRQDLAVLVRAAADELQAVTSPEARSERP